jgi:hypothetical protein
MKPSQTNGSDLGFQIPSCLEVDIASSIDGCGKFADSGQESRIGDNKMKGMKGWVKVTIATSSQLVSLGGSPMKRHLTARVIKMT